MARDTFDHLMKHGTWPTEWADYAAHESKAKAAFHSVLFDSSQGAYRDGEGTDHLSLHANLFPLAFDLVPADQRAKVAAWVAERGMRCSVYAAQYLLEGLFFSSAFSFSPHLDRCRN